MGSLALATATPGQPTADKFRAPVSTGAALSSSGAAANGASLGNGSSLSHLKLAPSPKAVRDRLHAHATATVADWDPTRPLTKDETEAAARRLLETLDLPEGYVGWTMVLLTSCFWKQHVAAVPLDRRLLLLPAHDSDRLTQLARHARQRGYRVAVVGEGQRLPAEVLAGGFEAVLGVATLDVLEKAIDKLFLAGFPCMAVPLLEAGLQVRFDDDRVAAMIDAPYVPALDERPTYMHLMRAAAGLFEPSELNRLAPRLHSPNSPATDPAKVEPISGTEAIAYDFLARGGKHSRPFITLAVYDALTGCHGAGPQGAAHLANLPDAVKRAALSIETFHKASLVHDDIEDEDAFRYGQATLHRVFGAATAINVGDYLIGLGYRLVSRERRVLGAEVAADILERLAEAHMKLAEGQGAELLWRDAASKRLGVADAVKIYGQKTAPAFEAALFTGLRLAGPADHYSETVTQFAMHLGVAFQILNDLADWQGDVHNKLRAGGDLLGGRPTVLWALALDRLTEPDRVRLEALAAEGALCQSEECDRIVAETRVLYQRAEVFARAHELVQTHRAAAERVAATIQPAPLQDLLSYLIDTVLQRFTAVLPQSTAV